MNSATIYELQSDAPSLLARVEAGESIWLTRDNRPVAELRPIRSTFRPYGLAAGEFVVPDDFDEPLSEDSLMEFGTR